MPEAMLPHCASCVLLVCSERGRSESADAWREHGVIYSCGEGLRVWLQVGRVGRSRVRPDCGNW
jgi:hypothetical protein